MEHGLTECCWCADGNRSWQNKWKIFRLLVIHTVLKPRHSPSWTFHCSRHLWNHVSVWATKKYPYATDNAFVLDVFSSTRNGSLFPYIIIQHMVWESMSDSCIKVLRRSGCQFCSFLWNVSNLLIDDRKVKKSWSKWRVAKVHLIPRELLAALLLWVTGASWRSP